MENINKNLPGESSDSPVEKDEKPIRQKRKTKSTSMKADAKSAGFCVYLGPTIRGKIQYGTIIRGSKAQALETLKSVVKKYPSVKELVVTSTSLPAARIKVKTPGTLLNLRYKQVMNSVNVKT